MSLGLSPGAWEAVGFFGQGLFTARFLVQWLASEKKRESVVPVSFWWLSLVGSAILASYAAFGRGEPVFLLVSLINGFLYARNLYLAYFAKGRATSRKVLIPSVLAIAAFLIFAGTGKVDTDVPVPVGWLVFGFAGTACWSGRFVIQWYASERAGRSVMPRSFWYVGLAGAVLLLAYSIYRQMPVFILGYLFPVFPYIRNLSLIYRKEGAPRPIRLAQEVWRDPGRRGNAIAIFCVVLSAFLSVRAVRSDPGSQFERLYGATRLVVTGRAAEIYSLRAALEVGAPAPLDRPPALAVALAPIGFLSVRAAVALWTVLNGLAFLLALGLLFGLVRRDGVRAAWMWVPFLVGLRFAWDAMSRGQPTPLLLLLLIGGLERAERGKTRSSVLLLSLATLFSPVLGIAGAWCATVYRRRLGFFLGVLLVSVPLAILLPATVLGPTGAMKVLWDYSAVAARDFSGLTRVAGFGEPLLSPKYWYIGAVAQAAWMMVAALVGAAFLAMAVEWIRGVGRSAGVVYGAVVALGLGVAGGLQQEHFLLLVVPAAALAVDCVAQGFQRARVRIGVAALLAALALAAVPSRAIVGKAASEFLLDHGSLPAAALLLFAGLLITGSRERDEAVPER